MHGNMNVKLGCLIHRFCPSSSLSFRMLQFAEWDPFRLQAQTYGGSASCASSRNSEWQIIPYSNTVSCVRVFIFLAEVQSITPFLWGITPRNGGSVAAIPVRHSGLRFLDTFEDEPTTSCRNVMNPLSSDTASYPRRMVHLMTHVYTIRNNYV